MQLNNCFQTLESNSTILSKQHVTMHKKTSFSLRISSVILQLSSHLLKKSLMKNFIFCAVLMLNNYNTISPMALYILCRTNKGQKSMPFLVPKIQNKLRILTRKNHRQINSSAYEKYEYGRLGSCQIKSTLYKRFLNLNEISKK